MLPFSKPERNKRNYQCFVCGREFGTFQEFKEHIVSDHEEGREYVNCPQCSSPVRDLTIHFKALHPRDTIPPGILKKALIWRDFSSKKKKTNKPKFHGGQFVSMKNEGQLMTYRSGWELQVYECLEELKAVNKYEVEALKIPYYWRGKWHNYYPDILVWFEDGTKEVWEIKPSNQTEQEKNQAKWDACAKYCLAHGMRFVVQTEKGIQLLKTHMLRESRGQ